MRHSKNMLRVGAALVSRVAAAPTCRVASRGFAEKAAPMTAAEKLGESFIQPPIPQFGLAGRYSSALYSAASKNKTLDTVEKELASFKKLIATDDNLKMFLMDKSIARKKKAEAVKGIMGDLKMSVTTTQLFVVLAENGRMAEASKVIDMFAAQMMASKGQVPAQVTSAEPLEKAELDELTKTLKGLIGKGETLLLTQKVDKSIIGGLIIDLGERHIDMSIDAKIKKMEALLLETI